ncbi:MAG: hypothetical protein WBA46_07825 [Thermomicrobiales bacterium]
MMPRVPKHLRVWNPVTVICPACGHTLVAGGDVEVEILRWNRTEVVSGGCACPACGVRLVIRRWFQTVDVTAGTVAAETRPPMRQSADGQGDR